MFKILRPAIALMMMLFASASYAADEPGVTPTEIKIGGVFPFSGPASPYGVIGHAILAYVQSVNDRGGINGRKINYIAYDDAYSPPKAVEQVRKLVEGDEVAFMFGQLGTPGNSAVAKYLKAKRIPSIGVITGANKFTNVADYPLTTTSIVSYDTEGKIYAKFLTKSMPDAKYGILYQNDDLGKDYVNAFKAILKDAFEAKVVAISYEVTDPTVDSQIVNLKSSGAGALLVAGTPKFAAQAIRRAAEIGWKPTIVLNYPSSSVSATLKPAGLERAVGVIVGQNLMDPVDTQWANDAGMKNYRAFLEKYMPGADVADTNIQYGYVQAVLLEHLMKQCGSDLSRENIIKQAKSLKNVMLPTLLPGISVNTSDKINMNYTQMRLQRWSGTAWELFGEVLDASSE
ncbi:ABC transporter substrate-binding protein [Bradyrhizobium yuanmingense]|uniref:ABC transporter substrate-binding protein n=1 Tax=Bradyrhizobium yuanmingense TaxID=108015 RepID=UPI0023B9897D|nr:ABC transporter substrate-binding protein [Bradyrhizobium yuanmingense]MDF0518676.1 ABC transporter substrate-binding protein [Bradyrhizobium yuanmingense]